MPTGRGARAETSRWCATRCSLVAQRLRRRDVATHAAPATSSPRARRRQARPRPRRARADRVRTGRTAPLRRRGRARGQARDRSRRRSAAITPTCFKTIARSRLGLAPSASRKPISRVRCVTLYASTPYSPMPASSVASAAKPPRASTADDRCRHCRSPLAHGLDRAIGTFGRSRQRRAESSRAALRDRWRRARKTHSDWNASAIWRRGK